MSDLRQWQDALAGAIDGRPADGVCTAAVAESGLAAATGCAVYRNSSRAARALALDDVYPVCRRLLGPRAFDGLAREFVRRAPSTGPDLNRFGDGLAAFVERVTREHDAFAGLPWLADLVALEWACHRIHYAPDDPPADLRLLHTADPRWLLPRPAGALEWLRSRWPVHEIHAAHGGVADPPAMRLVAGDCCLVVERAGFEARVRVVDPELWMLLAACDRNGGRRRSLDELARDRGLDVCRLGELVGRGWLVGLDLRDNAV